MYKLEKKTSVLVTVQGGGGNRTHTRTKNKGRNINKSYAEGLNNIESWIFKTSKDKITIDGQYWYWCPKNNMVGKFDEMYKNHPSNKHDEWYEENQRNREA